MPKETVEVLARMSDSKLQVRDVVSKWLLLTYDIPHTEEGDKARQQFLMTAAAIGATRHTDSVYLMPDTPEAAILALELAEAKGGEVIVWGGAEPRNNQDAITRNYDISMRKIMKDLSGRLTRMETYRYTRHQKRVLQMIPKTERILNGLPGAVERRGSEMLADWLKVLKDRFVEVVR